MLNRELCAQFPALAALAEQADDLHVISFATRPCRCASSWLQACLTCRSGSFLYRVRKCFVGLLGISQDGIPGQGNIRPQDLSFRAGDKAGMFTVISAQEISRPGSRRRRTRSSPVTWAWWWKRGTGYCRRWRISGATWRGWKGRVYYAVILLLPFHHLVVRCMVKHAQKCNARRSPAAQGTGHGLIMVQASRTGMVSRRPDLRA